MATPAPPRPSRNRWLVPVAVLAVFVSMNLLSRYVDPDGTGRAVGGRGCGAAEDPDEREALVATLDGQLGDPALWILPAPPTNGDWSAFPQLPTNPITDAKVALGKELFFEPGIMVVFSEGLAGTASCGTCHDPTASFGAGTVMGRGVGAGGEGRGGTRALAAGVQPGTEDFPPFNERRIVNVAWTSSVAGWQGDFSDHNPEGIDGLEDFITTALFGHGVYARDSESPPEDSVLAGTTYDALYAAAFPEAAPQARKLRRMTAFALASYVRSITTWDAPFQRFLRGEDGADGEFPLSNASLRGAVVFFGEGRCSQCHTGPALASARFENIGTLRYEPSREYLGYRPSQPAGENGWGTLAQYYEGESSNLGYAVMTGDAADTGRFLVPSAYGAGNANLLAFGHGGAHDNLGDFLAHKVGGNDPARNPTLDPTLLAWLSPTLYSSAEPLLDAAQIEDLVAFFEQGLEDAGIEARHAPKGDVSLSGRCSPNNDAVSRATTPGCRDL